MGIHPVARHARQRRALGITRSRRSSPRARWTSAATTSFFIRQTSGSRSTNPSGIQPSSTAPWDTKPTSQARASSHRRKKFSASSATDLRS
jgi:hypothetical protein